MNQTSRCSTASTNVAAPLEATEEGERLAPAYYPPRAGWGRAFWYTWNDFRRALFGNSGRQTAELSAKQMLLGLALPGYAFHLIGYRRTGNGITLGYGLAAIIFFIGLGHLASDLCFAAMLSAHGTSATQVLVQGLSLRTILMRGLTTLVALASLFSIVYRPGREWILSEWALPLQMEKRVVMVNPGLRPSSVRRGELVAYNVSALGDGGYRRREGFGLDPVVALPGDIVHFWPDRCEVNGRPGKRLAHMPGSGTLQLREKEWLIWPRHIRISANQTERKFIDQLVLDMAKVRQEQLVGRPFRHWFGWRQANL